MNFKVIILTLAVCVLSVSFEVNAQDEVDFVEQPQLQLSYNFGQAKQGDIVSHTFKILNNSQFMWQIRAIMPSCGCVSANLIDEKEQDKDINPGEIFQIEVKIDTTDYEGVLEQFVNVDVMQKEEMKVLKLVIEGEVMQEIDLVNPADVGYGAGGGKE